MEVLFTRQFARDIKGLKSKSVACSLEEVIKAIKLATSPNDISNLKKLKGGNNAYRVRIGDYRLGLYISGSTVEFCRFMKRSELYKFFP